MDSYLLGIGYRDYYPKWMRFRSPDSSSPFGEGGLNAYGYCEGDPVNYADPSGHGRTNKSNILISRKAQPTLTRGKLPNNFEEYNKWTASHHEKTLALETKYNELSRTPYVFGGANKIAPKSPADRVPTELVKEHLIYRTHRAEDVERRRLQLQSLGEPGSELDSPYGLPATTKHDPHEQNRSNIAKTSETTAEAFSVRTDEIRQKNN